MTVDYDEFRGTIERQRAGYETLKHDVERGSLEQMTGTERLVCVAGALGSFIDLATATCRVLELLKQNDHELEALKAAMRAAGLPVGDQPFPRPPLKLVGPDEA